MHSVLFARCREYAVVSVKPQFKTNFHDQKNGDIKKKSLMHFTEQRESVQSFLLAQGLPSRMPVPRDHGGVGFGLNGLRTIASVHDYNFVLEVRAAVMAIEEHATKGATSSLLIDNGSCSCTTSNVRTGLRELVSEAYKIKK